ncbi:rRNA methyltransferase [Stenotrophomonas panacihumi]|nr:TrmH family RNA methyltransferase [Stenotrophomonas panacihumi]PTN54867.1 rRNA methyltransferase [Stenotrophomonas panacihumi]
MPPPKAAHPRAAFLYRNLAVNDPWKSHRSPRPAEPRGGSRPAGPRPPRPPRDPAEGGGAPPRGEELRLYGRNAVLAVFKRRPAALRKLYLSEAMIPKLQPLLKWCVAHRVGYRVVEPGDLDKLAASQHHEGVVADVQREPIPALADWLTILRPGPKLLLWLDGVGNPHNFGAILRSAAHFGVSAILLPEHSPLALSGAAARVAEGGAEAVALVRLPKAAQADELLHDAGFVLAATLVDGGQDLFTTRLPSRLVYVLGAEGEGMDRGLAEACDLRLSIPGSGAVESLNVASATAVLLASWRARVQAG